MGNIFLRFLLKYSNASTISIMDLNNISMDLKSNAISNHFQELMNIQMVQEAFYNLLLYRKEKGKKGRRRRR
jgi:hypothetical protein